MVCLSLRRKGRRDHQTRTFFRQDGRDFPDLSRLRHTSPLEVIFPPEKSVVIFRDLQDGKVKFVCVHLDMAQVRVAMAYHLLLSYIKFMSKTALSLTAFARRVKEGLMMQLDQLEMLCLVDPKSMKPPDGQAADQMVFILWNFYRTPVLWKFLSTSSLELVVLFPTRADLVFKKTVGKLVIADLPGIPIEHKLTP